MVVCFHQLCWREINCTVEHVWSNHRTPLTKIKLLWRIDIYLVTDNNYSLLHAFSLPFVEVYAMFTMRTPTYRVCQPTLKFCRKSLNVLWYLWNISETPTFYVPLGKKIAYVSYDCNNGQRKWVLILEVIVFNWSI